MNYIQTDLLAFLITAVLGSAVMMSMGRKFEKPSAFVIYAGGTALVLFMDMIAAFLRGQENSLRLAIIVTNAVLLAAMLVSGFYTYYVYLYLSEREQIASLYFKVTVTLKVIALVPVIGLFQTDHLYRFADGEIVKSLGYYLILTLFSLISILDLIAVIRYRDSLESEEFYALSACILLPLISSLAALASPRADIIFPINALVLLITYIIRQEEAVEEVTTESLTDELTGLLNHRAYESMLNMVPADRRAGVVYCDLNALRFTNDNYGHVAGDELILKFVKALKMSFRKNEIFRIGGDEFVVILPGITESALEFRVTELKEQVAYHPYPIASIGVGWESEMEIREIVAEAERDMKAEKQNFHRYYPQYTSRNGFKEV